MRFEKKIFFNNYFLIFLVLECQTVEDLDKDLDGVGSRIILEAKIILDKDLLEWKEVEIWEGVKEEEIEEGIIDFEYNNFD